MSKNSAGLMSGSLKQKFMSSTWHGRTAATGRKSFEKKRVEEKQNRCVILPAATGVMIAETIERKENNWFVRTKEASDLIIRVEYNSTFHLHMAPMVSRSGYLNRMAFERRREDGVTIEIENLPGGADIFELVVKFCYGWKVDLTPTNIAPLYCAAHFLEMRDDDLGKGNLISRTETFLSFIIFTSWKDTFRVLRTCEESTMSLCARDLKIQTRCSEAIAWKVCLDTKAIALGQDDAQCFDYLTNGKVNLFNYGKVSENWWFEDVSALRVDHFVEVITLVKKRKRAEPKLLGSCVAYWTAKWVSRIGFKAENLVHGGLTDHHLVDRVTIESLIRILPNEDNSVCCSFLLHLLKLGLLVKINNVLLCRLERRIIMLLEECQQPLELLVRNYGEGSSSGTPYDVKVIARVVEAYNASISAANCCSSLKVARMVDGFLMMIAKDKNLTPEDFQLVAESIPKNARYSNDNLYRAIDSYLKAHPELTEEDRKGVCRAMEYHKLSQAAREHVMRNVDRLPANLTAQLILLEHVKMVRSMITDSAIDYDQWADEQGGNTAGSKRWDRRVVKKEMRVVKEEVERLKVRLSKLQGCKVGIKRMMEMEVTSSSMKN